MIEVIGIIALLIIFLIVIQIARTSELVSVIRGDGETTHSTNKINAYLMLVVMVVGLLGIIGSVFYYKDGFLPVSASEHGVWIDSMFNWTLFFTGIVFLITQIILFYFAFKYRSTKKTKAFYYPENNKLELLWTAVPAVVLTFLVVMGLESWFKIFSPVPDDHHVVEVTGYQFGWNVRYPGLDGELGKNSIRDIEGSNILGIDWTDEASHDDILASEIHLPVDKPVLFKLGSKDVLHSFFLPHFRVKMDCVPGIPTQFWFTPTITTEEMREITGNPDFDYILACAELCGAGHYNMGLTVIVGTQEEHDEWVSSQRPLYEILNIAEQMEEKTESDEEPATEISSDEEVEVKDLISAL
ncbi:MAG: cytochrome c oxidase subunit II [Chitinophagaceae bacterium]|nr:MAG: cytochrome c oxidase subunit II [Chitinophagaceae bacterium]